MKMTTLLLAVLFFSACVSFKVSILDEPEEMVDYIAICKKIEKEGDFNKEIPSEVVEKSDQVIYALIKVNNISKPLSLKWKWFNPRQELVKTSKTLEVNKGEKYLEFFVAWDSLSNDYFKDQPGNWNVVILARDRFLYKKDFEIR